MLLEHLATDRDRRRRVTDERTVRVASVRLGERDAPPHALRSSKDFDRPLVGAHRLEVADLDLDRSVAGAGRGARVDGATGGGSSSVQSRPPWTMPIGL
jgi:hypothetical protein